MATVYKVVLNWNGALQSVNALGAYRTVYTPGEWVEKKNIFVFAYLEDAENAVYEGLDEELWECETTSTPRLSPTYVPDFDHTGYETYEGVPPYLVPELIQEFWDSPYAQGLGPLKLLRPLRNTYLVDNVKLIRRIVVKE